MTIDPVIATIVQYALAWLFLAAAAHKVRDIADFRSVVATYRVLPDAVVGVTAWIVVGVEVAIGIGALLQQRSAFVGAIVVLLGYAALIGINLWRGRRFIDCGCGAAAQPLSLGLVVRNVVLAVAALCALVPTALRAVGWVDIVSMVAGVLVAGTLYAAANQLLAARARLEEWV
jgi:hypothetical protein